MYLHYAVVGGFAWGILIKLGYFIHAGLKAGEVLGGGGDLFDFLRPKEIRGWDNDHGVKGQDDVNKFGAILVVLKLHSHF